MGLNTLATAGALQPRRAERRQVQIQTFPGLAQVMIDTKQFPKNFVEGDLADFNGRFVQILQQLRLRVQEDGLELTPAERDGYLHKLGEVGRAAFYKLFIDDARTWMWK